MASTDVSLRMMRCRWGRKHARPSWSGINLSEQLMPPLRQGVSAESQGHKAPPPPAPGLTIRSSRYDMRHYGGGAGI